MVKRLSLLLGILMCLGAFLCQKPERLLWQTKLGPIPGLPLSPALGKDGTIYVGCSDGKLYAVTPDGTIKWITQISFKITASPTVGKDGTIYVGDYSGRLFAVNHDGSVKWQVKVNESETLDDDILSSVSIGPEGNLYLLSGKNLVAVGPEGSLLWSYETPHVLMSVGIAIDSKGVLYFTAMDSCIHAVNPDGTVKWKFQTHKQEYGLSPAIGEEGTIYCGSWNHYVLAINPDGSIKWAVRTGWLISSTPAIGSDGIIYVGSGDHNLYAINPDGSLKWKYKTKGEVGSPSVGADGIVYVANDKGHIYAISPTGELLWKYKMHKRRFDNAMLGAPAISEDGKLYFCARNTLHALKISSPGLAQSPWPKFGADNQNTGRVNAP